VSSAEQTRTNDWIDYPLGPLVWEITGKKENIKKQRVEKSYRLNQTLKLQTAQTLSRVEAAVVGHRFTCFPPLIGH
jgi:hypothetical protein